MQQVFCNGVAGIFLSVCTFQDIKTGKIAGNLILLFGVLGILIDFLFHIPWQECAKGMFPGMIILLFGKLSKEQIGYGDGLVMCVLGFFLSGRKNINLLLTALFLCAICAVILFVTGKLKRRMTVPFLPFLTAGFVIHTLSDYLR